MKKLVFLLLLSTLVLADATFEKLSINGRETGELIVDSNTLITIEFTLKNAVPGEGAEVYLEQLEGSGYGKFYWGSAGKVEANGKVSAKLTNLPDAGMVGRKFYAIRVDLSGTEREPEATVERDSPKVRVLASTSIQTPVQENPLVQPPSVVVPTKPARASVETPGGLITDFSVTPESVEAGGKVVFTVVMTPQDRDAFVAFSLRNDIGMGLFQTTRCGTRITAGKTTGSLECYTNAQASGVYNARVKVVAGPNSDEDTVENAVTIGGRKAEVVTRGEVKPTAVKKPVQKESTAEQEKQSSITGTRLVVKLNRETGRGIFQKTYPNEVVVPKDFKEPNGFTLKVDLSSNRRTLTIRAQAKDAKNFKPAGTMMGMIFTPKEKETVEVDLERDDFNPQVVHLNLPDEDKGVSYKAGGAYANAKLKCKANEKVLSVDCSSPGVVKIKSKLAAEDVVEGKKTSLTVWNAGDNQIRLMPVVIIGQPADLEEQEG